MRGWAGFSWGEAIVVGRWAPAPSLTRVAFGAMEMSLVADGSRVDGRRGVDRWVGRSRTLQRRPEVREGKEAKSPKGLR